MTIYNKLAAVKKEIGAISKDETNPFFKSKYFDINGLLRHTEPLLQKNGLLLLQPILKGEVHSRIIDTDSGESVTSSIALPNICLLYTSPSPRDGLLSRMPSSA